MAAAPHLRLTVLGHATVEVLPQENYKKPGNTSDDKIEKQKTRFTFFGDNDLNILKRKRNIFLKKMLRGEIEMRTTVVRSDEAFK